MQDSFEARMQGQTPETVKPKSSKGWMICSIILLFVLVGVCVFGGMIIMKGDRDTNRLSEVEQQLKEKDEKIAELEKKIEEASSSTEGDENNGQGSEVDIDDEETVRSELDSYIKSTKMKPVSGYDYSYKIKNFGLTKDKKYYYASITVSVKGGSNDSSVEYRAAKGGKWAYVNGGQAVTPCSDFSEDVLNFIKTYGAEFKDYAQCSDENHKTIDYSGTM